MRAARIASFDFQPGRVLAGRYTVELFLGGGLEGEVYGVVEQCTGIRRAAKVFYPHHNVKDRAVRAYATKLDRLRKCAIVIQYHHSVSIRHRGVEATCLISELVDGELFSGFVARQPGKRLHYFEALHLLYALTSGLEQIHRVKEYHGDLHDDNVLLKRRGIGFDVRVVDFYPRGAPTRDHQREDIIDLIRLFYDALGGQKRYRSLPPELKEICRGLRRDLIINRFPTADRLREYLESFEW